MYTKGNHKQKDNPQNGKKYLQTDQQGINLQNIQTAHAAQCQENKQPNHKVERRLRHFSKEDIQMANKHMKNITNY